MFDLLRRPSFACWWLAGLVSLIGDRALLTALPFFIYQETGSTIATAGMAVTSYLPAVLLSAPAGVLVDRWDRRRTLVIANLIQVIVLLLLLLIRSSGPLWLAYLVTFLELSVATVVGPAQGALLPTLVEADQLVAANALGGFSTSLARLAGPAVGGALFAFAGLGGVALADSASFLLAAVLLSFVAAPTGVRQKPGRFGGAVTSALLRFWQDWSDGARLIGASRLIVVLCAVFTVTSLGGTMLDPLYAPFVRAVLHGDASVLGWLATVGAVGGVLGGLVAGHVVGRIEPRQLLSLGTIAVGLLMLAQYHQTAIPPAMALGFLLDFALVWEGIGAQTLLQGGVPDRFRGRVYGFLGTTSALVGLLGAPLGGGIAAAVGVVPAMTVGAGVTILAGLIALLLLPRPGTPSDHATGRAAPPPSPS